MRPLSLRSFAEAESLGCGLDALLSEDPETKGKAWIEFYALLAGISAERALELNMTEPQDFKQFFEAVIDSFGSSDDAKEPETSHHRVKDPREKFGRKPAQGDSEGGAAKRSFGELPLLRLSRLTGIGLSDLLDMTFRGIKDVASDLEEHPPTPGAGLLAGLLG